MILKRRLGIIEGEAFVHHRFDIGAFHDGVHVFKGSAAAHQNAVQAREVADEGGRVERRLAPGDEADLMDLAERSDHQMI